MPIRFNGPALENMSFALESLSFAVQGDPMNFYIHVFESDPSLDPAFFYELAIGNPAVDGTALTGYVGTIPNINNPASNINVFVRGYPGSIFNDTSLSYTHNPMALPVTASYLLLQNDNGSPGGGLGENFISLPLETPFPLAPGSIMHISKGQIVASIVNPA